MTSELTDIFNRLPNEIITVRPKDPLWIHNVKKNSKNSNPASNAAFMGLPNHQIDPILDYLETVRNPNGFTKPKENNI